MDHLCVSFPRRTPPADLPQASVQYLVFAVRRLGAPVGGCIALAGVSQGGLLIRMTLTDWPSLRLRATDAVTAAAATHHALGDAEGAC